MAAHNEKEPSKVTLMEIKAEPPFAAMLQCCPLHRLDYAALC